MSAETQVAAPEVEEHDSAATAAVDRAEFDRIVGTTKLTKDDEDGADDPQPESRASHKKRVIERVKTTPKAKPQGAEGEEGDEEEAEEAESDGPEEESETEEGESESEESDDDKSDAGPSEYSRARALVQLKQKLTDDELHRMPKSVVIKMAASWREAMKAEAAWKKQQGEAKTKGEESNEQRTDAREPAKSGPALAGLRAAKAKLLKGLDPDSADAVVEYLEEALGGTVGDITKRFDELGSGHTKRDEALQELRLENYRLRYMRKHTDLADDLDDDRTWGRVVKEARRLREDDEGVGEFESPDQLFTAAAHRVLSDRNSKTQSLRKQVNGAAKVPVQRTKAPRKRTENEMEREAFDVATDRDLTKEARKRRLDKIVADPFD